MAGRMFHAYKAIANYAKTINIANSGRVCNGNINGLITPQILTLQSVRNSSFYTKRTATQLWKSVNSVSNAGKRRGRGRSVPKIKDLNKGQRLGVGKIPIIFPGFNAPVLQGNHIVHQRHLSEDEAPKTTMEGSEKSRKKKKGLVAIRGWTGGKPGGRKVGPPNPVDGENFNNFESWILQSKSVSIMKSTLGRYRTARSFIITGNRKGLAGFAVAKGNDVRSTINTAKAKAVQRLIYVERYNDHTVFHDFFTQFANTKIFVTQKEKGYGLKCHRVIRACCEALGISDLYAKVEGSTNVQNIVKAFFIGLLKQKTHEQMAREKSLHLVELREENYNYPTLLASPPKARTRSEIPPDEILDFKQYVMDGRVRLQKKRPVPFYEKLPSWIIHLRKEERRRGQDDVIIRLRAEYGDLCSFHAEKYPEAAAPKPKRHNQNEEIVGTD